MHRNYNYVYSKLVTSDDDLVGHVAYALYKKEKIEYIELKNNDGNPLTDADLIPFNEISSTQAALDGFRIKADILLQGFIDNVLDEAKNDIEQQAIFQQSEILKDVVKPLKRNVFADIGIGILSAFIFALLLILFSWILKFQGTDISVDINATQKTEAPK